MSDSEHLKRITFSGSSKITDLKTDKDIKISGSGRLEGKLECMSFKSSGSFKGSGDILTHGELHSSGTLKITGSLISNGFSNHSGTTRLIGNIVANGGLQTSGTLNVVGGINVGSDAGFSGHSIIHDELLVNGNIVTSGSFESNSMKSSKKIRTSGTLKVNEDIKAVNSIEIDGSGRIGGNILADSILIDQHNPVRGMWHFLAFILQYFKKARPYKIKGNLLAKNVVSADRVLISGDIRARDVNLGRFSIVRGTIYYVDNCDIHEKAVIDNPPIRININDL